MNKPKGTRTCVTCGAEVCAHVNDKLRRLENQVFIDFSPRRHAPPGIRFVRYQLQIPVGDVLDSRFTVRPEECPFCCSRLILAEFTREESVNEKGIITHSWLGSLYDVRCGNCRAVAYQEADGTVGWREGCRQIAAFPGPLDGTESEVGS